MIEITVLDGDDFAFIFFFKTRLTAAGCQACQSPAPRASSRSARNVIYQKVKTVSGARRAKTHLPRANS